MDRRFTTGEPSLSLFDGQLQTGELQATHLSALRSVHLPSGPESVRLFVFIYIFSLSELIINATRCSLLLGL